MSKQIRHPLYGSKLSLYRLLTKILHRAILVVRSSAYHHPEKELHMFRSICSFIVLFAVAIIANACSTAGADTRQNLAFCGIVTKLTAIGHGPGMDTTVVTFRDGRTVEFANLSPQPIDTGRAYVIWYKLVPGSYSTRREMSRAQDITQVLGGCRQLTINSEVMVTPSDSQKSTAKK